MPTREQVDRWWTDPTQVTRQRDEIRTGDQRGHGRDDASNRLRALIGLAQAILESGLKGTARSGANALGFCQFLRRNWDRLNRATPHVIEAFNQTTQAPYCAAYLSVLATMYGSFIPALSEHHAGGVNVGRAVINGERLGGTSPREQYLLARGFRGNGGGVEV